MARRFVQGKLTKGGAVDDGGRFLSLSRVRFNSPRDFVLSKLNSGGSYSPGQAGPVGLSLTIAAQTEQIVLTTNPADIPISRTITTFTEVLETQVNTASVSFDRNIQAGTESISVSTQPASIATDKLINAVSEQITVIGNSATVQLDKNIQANTEQITLTTNPATIRFDKNIIAQTEVIALTENSATAKLSKNITTNTESIQIIENSSTLKFDRNFTASTEQINLTGNLAVINNQQPYELTVGQSFGQEAGWSDGTIISAHGSINRTDYFTEVLLEIFGIAGSPDTFTIRIDGDQTGGGGITISQVFIETNTYGTVNLTSSDLIYKVYSSTYDLTTWNWDATGYNPGDGQVFWLDSEIGQTKTIILVP